LPIRPALESPALVIGGEQDHVHALFRLPKKRPLIDVIEGVKRSSSKWIKTQGEEFTGFRWQSGYGAFSVSQSQVPRVRRYIEHQEEHHKTVSFQEEFRTFLQRYEADFDERYIWD
jgi:putative transposase